MMASFADAVRLKSPICLIEEVVTDGRLEGMAFAAFAIVALASIASQPFGSPIRRPDGSVLASSSYCAR
jgi:hypothetical protein